METSLQALSLGQLDLNVLNNTHTKYIHNTVVFETSEGSRDGVTQENW